MFPVKGIWWHSFVGIHFRMFGQLFDSLSEVARRFEVQLRAYLGYWRSLLTVVTFLKETSTKQAKSSKVWNISRANFTLWIVSTLEVGKGWFSFSDGVLHFRLQFFFSTIGEFVSGPSYSCFRLRLRLRR